MCLLSLARCLPRPHASPVLAAESRAGKAWPPSQAVKVRKLETEINPQSCSVVKVAASRPRQPPNTLGPLPPSCHWHPINAHMYLRLYKRVGDREAEPRRQSGRLALAGPAGWPGVLWGRPHSLAETRPSPGFLSRPHLHDNRILRMLQPPRN